LRPNGSKASSTPTRLDAPQHMARRSIIADRKNGNSVRGALSEGMAKLREANVPSHTLAAELLLMHVLGRDRTWLYAHAESVIEPARAEAYFALIARRAAGEPTQYLTGKQEFWGLEFEVNRDVLIPRPETEHVVEVALERLPRRTGERDVRAGAGGKLRIADVGTGSGSIAVALATELPNAEIVATDISKAALEVARRNAIRHGAADRIELVKTNLLEQILHDSRSGDEDRVFDLIASNPPYLAHDEKEALPREVREHEPHVALFGGATGTDVYARLIEQAGTLLRLGGVLVMELGYNSAPQVAQLLRNAAWTNVEMTNDLAGIPRVISAVKAIVNNP
jgi:release factor glutamine methyltransferase